MCNVHTERCGMCVMYMLRCVVCNVHGERCGMCVMYMLRGVVYV